MVQIRPVQSLEELRSAWHLMQHAFDLDDQHPRNLAFYTEILHDTPSLLLIAEDDGEQCGVLMASVEGDHVLVGEVLVAPAYRGQGIGSTLLATLEHNVRQLGQHRLLLGSAAGAEAFYVRNGFVALLFIAVEAQHHALLDHLLRTDLAAYPLQWRAYTNDESKAIIAIGAFDPVLQGNVEQLLSGGTTQYLFTKEF